MEWGDGINGGIVAEMNRKRRVGRSSTYHSPQRQIQPAVKDANENNNKDNKSELDFQNANTMRIF